jgi:hypothetical protein
LRELPHLNCLLVVFFVSTKVDERNPVRAKVGHSHVVHFIRGSRPLSTELAARCSSNDETYPTKNKESLHLFLCNDGWVQKPFEMI